MRWKNGRVRQSNTFVHSSLLYNILEINCFEIAVFVSYVCNFYKPVKKKNKNKISCVHTYLFMRSCGVWLLWSLLPYGRTSMRTDCPLGSTNVKDPLFKIFRTEAKNTSRSRKSMPMIPLGSTCRATMERNPSTMV